MPNRNYINGRRREYCKIKAYRDQGFPVVFRSAGSHSPFDVVALNPSAGVIILEQLKTKKGARKVIRSEEKIIDGARIIMRYEVWG